MLSPGKDFLCIFHYNSRININYPNVPTNTLVRAEVLPIWNFNNTEYCPVFVNCQIPRNDEATENWPTSVSIVHDAANVTKDDLEGTRPGNNVFVTGGVPSVEHGNYEQIRRRQLAFCVKKLRFNFSDVVRMVEFLEMYSLLGVDKVYLYGASYSKQVIMSQNQLV